MQQRKARPARPVEMSRDAYGRVSYFPMNMRVARILESRVSASLDSEPSKRNSGANLGAKR